MKPMGAGFRWLIAGLAALLSSCATLPSGEPAQTAGRDSNLGLTGAALSGADWAVLSAQRTVSLTQRSTGRRVSASMDRRVGVATVNTAASPGSSVTSA